MKTVNKTVYVKCIEDFTFEGKVFHKNTFYEYCSFGCIPSVMNQGYVVSMNGLFFDSRFE